MIAKLTGVISEVFADFVIVDVSGVGYRVETAALGWVAGEPCCLYIYTHVREQELRLFGFRERQELVFFESLLQVSGVGPKVALSLLRNLELNNIVTAIMSNEPKSLKAPGVGAKIAQRIVIELNSKISKLGLNTTANNLSSAKRAANYDDDVQAALEALGYRQVDIEAAFAKVSFDSELDTASKIKLILQQL